MSEQVNTEAPAPSRSERIAQAWEAAGAETSVPETSDQQSVSSEEVSSETPVTSETLNEKPREVAASIREFLEQHREPPKPEGLELEVQELRKALAELRERGQEKPEVSEQQRLIDELKELRQREAERLAQQEQAETEAQFRAREQAYREGVIANLQARKEDYPATFALGREDVIVNELFSRLEQGQDASEYSVASEVEESLVKLYGQLHSVLGQSEDKPRASEPTQTLTSALAGNDSEEDLSKLSRREKIERAWARASNV